MSNNITKFLNSRVIELSGQKIELANLSDLKTAFKSLNSLEDKVLSTTSDFGDLKRKLIKENQDLDSEISKSQKTLIEFKKQASELGLSANSVKEFTDLEIMVNSVLGTVKDVNTITK